MRILNGFHTNDFMKHSNCWNGQQEVLKRIHDMLIVITMRALCAQMASNYCIKCNSTYLCSWEENCWNSFMAYANCNVWSPQHGPLTETIPFCQSERIRNLSVKLTSNEIVQPHVHGQFEQYKLFPVIYTLYQYRTYMQ